MGEEGGGKGWCGDEGGGGREGGGGGESGRGGEGGGGGGGDSALAALQKPKPTQGPFTWVERPPGRRGQRLSCTSDPAGPATDAVRSFRKPFSRLRLPDGGGWVPHSTGHGTGAAADGGGCRASVYDPVRHRTAFYSFHEAEGIDIHHVEGDEVRSRTLTLITRHGLSGSHPPPQPQRKPTVKPHTASVQPQPSKTTNTTPTNTTPTKPTQHTRASSPPIAHHPNSHPIHTLKQASEAEAGRLGEWVVPCSLRYNWKGNRYHIQATPHAMLIPYVFPPTSAKIHPVSPA